MSFRRIARRFRERPAERDQQRRLVEAQALAHVGHWEWPPGADRALCSDELCRIFALPAGASPTRDELAALVHPEDLVQLEAQIKAAKRTGESVGEYRIVRAGGEVRHVHGRRFGRPTPDGGALLFGTIQDITDLKLAERARHDAQELFENAFDHAPIGMALIGLDGRWLRANRAMCEIAGWPEEELLTKTFQDVTHPDDLDADLQNVEQLLRGKIDRYQMDKRYISRTGSVVWVNLSVSLARDPAGEPRYFISQVQDISQRKLDELVRNDERLALDEAQRIAQIGSWAWETRSRALTWSAEMYRLFGRDPDTGAPRLGEMLQYVHPEDRPQVKVNYGEAVNRRVSSELDFRIIRPDGSIRTLRGIGKPDPGRPEIYVGTVQDVTELRRAELDARQERDYAAAITRSMRDGFLLTRNGKILDINQALCDLTGFDRDALLGAAVPFPFWAPESIEEIRTMGDRVRRDPYSEFETLFVHRDGTRFPVSVHVVPAASQDGTLLGLVTTVRDISERKRHEDELNRLARQDALTGLANHRVFHDQLRAELARADRQQLQLSVAVLDLDHFKQINDRYGHLAGDQVLRDTGERLRSIVREGELLARVGGEEFAWILTGMGEEGAYAAVERARLAIGSVPFDQAGTVTISGGVAEIEPGETAEEVYRRADAALYRAKQSGRDRTVRDGADEAGGLAVSLA